MPLTITDFFEQVDRLSTEDAPPEVRARIDEELAELTDGFTGPQGEPSTGSSPGDPDAVVVDQDGAGDFETIQAALNDPDTDPGDTILIRAGRYTPADPIDVTDPGELRLIGAGQGSDPATNIVIEQAIDVTVNDAAGNGVTLRNLRLSNAGPFDAGGDGADLDAVFNASGPELRDVAVENVAFVGNADEGLEIDDTDQLAVRNCLSENNAGNVINGDRVTNATITACTIENNFFGGIEFEAVDGLTIRDSTIEGNIDGVNDPQVTDPAGVRALVRDLTVERSRIENNGESFCAGIRLIGNRVESFAVLNSVIAGNAGFGVVVNGFFTRNGAADVTIRNARSGPTATTDSSSGEMPTT